MIARQGRPVRACKIIPSHTPGDARGYLILLLRSNRVKR
jgi:hypothetical protein